MTEDKLFSLIESWQGSHPWGRVLDAGTGYHSLDWLLGLPTDGVVAITGTESRARDLGARLQERLTPSDRLVTTNWRDPAAMADERFETVLADYLLGAIDGFAPYFQAQLFGRLRRHVAGRLYVVGLEPYPEATTEGGRLIWEIARLRDACILLAGHRCYREYPLDWSVRSLEASGYRVLEAERVPIRYGARFINGQLDVCRRKLHYINDPMLSGELGRHIESLRTRALRFVEISGRIPFGEDYVIWAERA